MNESLDSAVHAALNEILDMGMAPGNEMIVGSGDQVLCHQRAGTEDIAGTRNVSEETLWRFYSMTKPITAVAVLQLVERGKIRLDDPLEHYLPEYGRVRVLREDGHAGIPTVKLTIRHLLTMTSGITYDGDGREVRELVAAFHQDRAAGRAWNTRKTAERYAEVPLAFEPGERFCYGFSYDILGAVIEQVAGMNLDTYCRENVFAPLGMKSSRIGAIGKGTEIAEGTRWTDAGKMEHAEGVDNGLVDMTSFTGDSWFSGGAGLVSTVSDYARFAAALAQEGQLGNARILGAEGVRMMRSCQLSETQRTYFNDPLGDACSSGPAYSYGMGVRVCAEDRLQNNCHKGEWGWAGAMGTWLSISPADDMFFVYAHQHAPADHDRYVPILLKAVYGHSRVRSA